MTRPDPLETPRRALVLLASKAPPPSTVECLDDDTVAALAEGTLAASVRPTVLPHLASCARCRTAVASVARALADPAVVREVTPGAGWRRVTWVAVPALAAAAVLFLLIRSPLRDDTRSWFREPAITAAPAPVPVSPQGVVATAAALRWSSVAGVDRYRVTVFDAASRVLYETDVADTTALLPDSVVLVPGASYLWKVEARSGWDRWSSSDLIEFSIGRGPPR